MAAGIEQSNCTVIYESSCAVYEIICQNLDIIDDQMREMGDDDAVFTYVVVDIGAATCDVTSGKFVIRNKLHAVQTELSVDAIASDDSCGGIDVTTNIIEYIMNELDEECGINDYHQMTKEQQNQFTSRIKKIAEKMKKNINANNIITYNIKVPWEDNQIVNVHLDKNQLRQILREMLVKIKYQCLQMIQSKQIDFIMFIGGTCRIPPLQEMILEWFNGDKKPRILSCVDETKVVAMGATKLGMAHFNGFNSVKYNECVGYNLSMSLPRDKVEILVSKYATLPFKGSWHIQSNVIKLTIYESRGVKATENDKLAQYHLKLNNNDCQQQTQWKITINVNNCGICSFTTCCDKNKAIKGDVTFLQPQLCENRNAHFKHKITTLCDKQEKANKIKYEIQTLKLKLKNKNIKYDKTKLSKWKNNVNGLSEQKRYLNEMLLEQQRSVGLSGSKRKYENKNQNDDQKVRSSKRRKLNQQQPTQ